MLCTGAHVAMAEVEDQDARAVRLRGVSSHSEIQKDRSFDRCGLLEPYLVQHEPVMVVHSRLQELLLNVFGVVVLEVVRCPGLKVQAFSERSHLYPCRLRAPSRTSRRTRGPEHGVKLSSASSLCRRRP